MVNPPSHIEGTDGAGGGMSRSSLPPPDLVVVPLISRDDWPCWSLAGGLNHRVPLRLRLADRGGDVQLDLLSRHGIDRRGSDCPLLFERHWLLLMRSGR